MKVNKFKCLIIDDEPLAIKVIQRHVEQMPILELVGTYQNPLEAFELLKTQTIDIIFLDIQMPVLTGMEFVRALAHPPGVIFTTAYRNYAVESYELNVVDYLVKPVTFSRFLKAVNKFVDQQATQKSSEDSPSSAQVALPTDVGSETISESIYVNSNKKYIKVVFEEITYVESIKDYIRIHTEGKNIITKDKISTFIDKLPNYFLRIHRSFIINTKKVSAFTALDIEIGKIELPIGNSYKSEVMDRLKK